MKCSEAHVRIGAEPGGTSPDLEQHLQDCAACREYRQEMRQLDEHIQRALQIDVAALRSGSVTRPNMRLVSSAAEPGTDSSPVPERTSWIRSMARQWALAASVLFAVAVGFVLWGALPRHSLAADVVAHVISEPLSSPQNPIAQAALDAVLRNANLRADPLHHDILFAQTCFFRGRLVPHFVVRSGGAAVTVLVLPNETLRAPEHFHDSGFNGIIYPNHGHGSIAVLSRTNLNSEKEALEILSALHLQPSA